MKPVRRFIQTLLRFLLVWIVDAISLILTSVIVPGVTFSNAPNQGVLVEAIAAAFVLGLVNFLIRPIILVISRPLGFFVMFAIGFLVNALALLMTSALLPEFQVTGVLTAIVAGIIFAAINIVLTGIVEVDEEGSYYQGLIERRAAREPFDIASEPGIGLVMMEIDGLSYHHISKALDDGILPTLQKMIDEEGYVLTKVDCGIPSQTSACQAGIMFGDNTDIPAFRWYDKDKQKLYVSGNDAGELNARYSGNGLMRGGSSIDNMLNGDASKSLLTLADLRTSDKEEDRQRAGDISLLMMHPYFFMRTIALFFGSTVRELWQGWQQRRKDVRPRLNRLEHFYPFVRAATCVLVRDISANLTILDIVRGSPSIYVTWPGYDEVAHHSGPWTSDAFGELKRYDSVIARVRRVIKEKAPRHYELVILSDHGQSFGATFKMRYGVSLKEFIEQQLPAGMSVSQTGSGDTGLASLTALHSELGNLQQQGDSAAARSIAGQSQKLLGKGIAQQEAIISAPATQVTAYGSGNLAQVYFDLYPRKILLSELNTAFPGMVDALVQHEGIGLVCGYLDDGTPVALGKGGQRNLYTGEVTGDDPLIPYAPATGHGAATIEKRVWQVRRVMDFPHAGDLMVISTVYPDGTVAALEELIGNHGGIGGEQTDAFIFHPPELEVTDTRNSIDVFHILNNRRGQPVPETPAQPIKKETDAWAPSNLWNGLKAVSIWVPHALRSFALDRLSFGEVAGSKLMTGPGLLLGLLGAFAYGWMRSPNRNVLVGAVNAASWLIAVLAVFAAGRLLTRKGNYTRTMRAMGFAQVIFLLELLTFIPALTPILRAATTLWHFIALWIAAAEAHDTRGWRTLILPLVAIVMFVLVFIGAAAILAGLQLTASTFLSALGWSPS
ncbi:MAG: phage holin family protein [Anaerolineae bacterium]|nr:phage holin family protein [Anaerolineae bacterium]